MISNLESPADGVVLWHPERGMLPASFVAGIGGDVGDKCRLLGSQVTRQSIRELLDIGACVVPVRLVPADGASFDEAPPSPPRCRGVVARAIESRIAAAEASL